MQTKNVAAGGQAHPDGQPWPVGGIIISKVCLCFWWLNPSCMTDGICGIFRALSICASECVRFILGLNCSLDSDEKYRCYFIDLLHDICVVCSRKVVSKQASIPAFQWIFLTNDFSNQIKFSLKKT